MAAKEKNKQQKTVVSQKPSPEHIIFSLKHLSRNNTYGMPAIDNKANNEAVYKSLFEKMYEASAYHLAGLRMLGKIRGSEPIPLKQFSDSVQNILTSVPIIDKESKMDVMRFGSQNYRLICKSDPVHNNILHIIAFDLDFSAYDHG